MFKQMFKTYSGLNRNVYALFVLTLIAAVGQCVFPYLAIIMTTKFGYDPKSAGYWVSAVTISGFTGMLTLGRLSDRFGRRKMLIVVISAACACLSICAIIANSTLLPFGIMVAVFCMMSVRPINNAVVADTTSPKDRNRAFALLYLGLNIGAALGNTMAGYLVNNHLWLMFTLCSVAFAAAVAIAFFLVDETRPAPETSPAAQLSDERADYSSTIQILLKKRILLVFTLLYILYIFVYAQGYFTLPLQLKALFGDHGTKVYANQNIFNCLLVVLFTTPLTALIRNNHPLKNVVITGVLYFAGFGMLHFNLPDLRFFYVSTLIWTIGEIICFPGMNAFITNHSPVNKRAGLNSVITSISFMGMWLGTSVNGMLINSYGIVNHWLIVAMVMAVATILMGILYFVDKGQRAKRLKAPAMPEVAQNRGLAADTFAR